MKSAVFKRKNIRLPAEYYLGERSYFLTLCFHRRRSYGAQAGIAHWLVDCLRAVAQERGFRIHAYCLMPDHLHLLATGSSGDSDVLDFVSSYKQKAGHAFSRKRGKPLWQFKFYDHILRQADAAEAVAWYIWLNPVRKGYCRWPQDYPYSGSFTETGTKLFRSLPCKEWVPPWRQPVPR